MRATGLIGELHRAISKYDSGSGPLRLKPIMDLILAITRGKVISWWSDEPEVPFLSSLFEPRHPIWSFLTVKKATKFGRELEAKTITTVVKRKYDYEDEERVVVISEPRNRSSVPGVKPEKVVLSLDCAVPGGVLYHASITPVNPEKTNWSLVIEAGENANYHMNYGTPGDLEVTIQEGLRKIISLNDTKNKAASKKVMQHLGLESQV